MLRKEPGARPSMPAVQGHPLWWSADTTLQFLVDISDRYTPCISNMYLILESGIFSFLMQAS
jgi:hypothetical protein